MTLYKHYVSLLPADPPPKLFKFPNLPNISVDLGDSVDLSFLVPDHHNGEVAIHIAEHRSSKIINYTFDDLDLSNFLERSHSYGVFQVEGVSFDSHGFLLSIKVVNDESAANTTGIEATMTLDPSPPSGNTYVTGNSTSASIYITLLKENPVSDAATEPPTPLPSYATPSNAMPSNATPTPSDLFIQSLANRGSTTLGTVVFEVFVVIILQVATLIVIICMWISQKKGKKKGMKKGTKKTQVHPQETESSDGSLLIHNEGKEEQDHLSQLRSKKT